MRTLLFAFLLVGLASVQAMAQTAPTVQTAPTGLPDVTSFSMGRTGVTFAFAETDTSEHRYAYEGGAMTLVLSSETGALSLAYGTQEINMEEGAPGLRYIQAGFSSGGNTYLFRSIAGQALAAYVPIRFQAEYRQVSYTDAVDEEQVDAPTLHLASGGLGLGAGAWYRLPPVLPMVGLLPVVFTDLVFSGGAMVDAGAMEGVHAARATEFRLEARIERLLRNQMGVTVGYGYRVERWEADSDRSFADVFDALQRVGNMERRNSRHLLRIGVNF